MIGAEEQRRPSTLLLALSFRLRACAQANRGTPTLLRQSRESGILALVAFCPYLSAHNCGSILHRDFDAAWNLHETASRRRDGDMMVLESSGTGARFCMLIARTTPANMERTRLHNRHVRR